MSEVKLPECPDYVAHPQSVWFEEHWRPALAAKDAEIEQIKSELAEKDAVLEFYSNKTKLDCGEMASMVLQKYRGDK